MKILQNSIIALVLSALVLNCSAPDRKQLAKNQFSGEEPTAEGYCVIFYKLDDYALIYVDDSLVLNTSKTHGLKPRKDVLIDLTPFLRSGDNDIKFELYNAECSDCNQNKWSMIYEMFLDQESFEYFAEDSNEQSDNIGLKVTSNHELTL